MLKYFFWFLLLTATTITSETEEDCEKIQIRKCPKEVTGDQFNKEVQEAFKVGYNTFKTMKHSLELTTALNVVNGVQIFVIEPFSKQTESFLTNSAHNFTAQMKLVIELAEYVYKQFEVILMCSTKLADNVYDKINCIQNVLKLSGQTERRDIKDRFRKTVDCCYNAAVAHRVRHTYRKDEYHKGQEILRGLVRIGENMLHSTNKEGRLTPNNIVGFMQAVAKDVLSIVKEPLYWIHPFRGSNTTDEVIRTMNELIERFKVANN